MSKYAQVAIIAARYMRFGYSPIQAWEKAGCEIFAPGSTAQKKGCPKNVFIGLFKNVHTVNGQYARKGLMYLKEHGCEDITSLELWDIVTEHCGKAHNSQMDVVIALYKERLV